MSVKFNAIFNGTVVKNQNLFDKNLFDVSYTWDFTRCLKSVDVEEELFVNYFSGRKDPLYKFIKKEYKWLLSNHDNVLGRYELKPIFDTEKIKIYDRLRNIAYKTCYIKYGHFDKVLRLKNRDNKAFQLYYTIVNKNIIFLVIDIYHMVIPAPNKEINEKSVNPKKTYEDHKLNRYCLSHLED